MCRLDGNHPDRPSIGGKGAWLDRLVAAGFVVPPTAVLPVEAYQMVASTPALSPLLVELRDGPLPPPEHHDQARTEVDGAFADVGLPGELAEAIRLTPDLLGAGPGTRFAVRSSATAEDLHGTSFAGQYRSLLEVTPDELEAAIRAVWASLWHPAPRAYRRFHGVSEAQLGMAVIVMSMVPARSAGVAFTVDPGGAADQVRVEVVEGLGEQLVSGAVTPDVHLVPRHEPDAPPGAAPTLAARVAATAEAIEAAFGEPQDVEWAWDGDELWILQARPITGLDAPTHDGFDTTTDPDDPWTTVGIAEMLPGVLPPLVWEVAGPLVEEAFRSLFDHLRGLPTRVTDGRHSFVGRIRGRAVLDLATMQAAAGLLPGGSAEDVEQQYFGAASGEQLPTAHPVAAHPLRRLRHDLVLTRLRHQVLTETATVLVATESVRRHHPDPAALEPDALLALRARLIDLAGRAMAAEALAATMAVAAYRRLELSLTRRLGPDEAASWAQRLTVGSSLAVPPRDEHASAAVFAGPTWAELGRAAPAPPPPPDPAATVALRQELRDRLRALPGWRRTRILTGQVVDVRIHVLERLIDDAVELLGDREATKAEVLALGGLVRAIHLELGARLRSAGALEQPADVDLLAEAELCGRRPRPSAAVLARRRRVLASWGEEPLLPTRFTGRPLAEVAVTGSEAVLHGWGAGPGRHTGRACVLRSSTDTGLARGDVLVAHSTDASWSPQFMEAGAIIVEEGGPLSHAAIVARELGIPAVLNVAGAMARLGTGTIRVEVDGDRGLVRILDDPTANPGDGDGT